ncbi:ribosomal protein s25 [Malassezia pachydermatis]|uniref:Ribosomal protein s25 n=1 Tax=Malassezia pachydermatis TaxID=77020 RepID=A0A0M8MIZ4_9BASI|nr:ribosomal protein s25 [Malassezia pachydermatis]KOS13406.1 ribosomal protein s25 [Malassezia pachydermatis]
MAILEEIQDDDKELLSQITGLKDSEIRTIRPSEAIRRSIRSKGVSTSRGTQPGDGDTPEEWDLNNEEYDSDEEIDDRMDTNAQDLYVQLEDDRLSSTMEAGFDLVAWFLPFAFMFEMLNLLVQKQYNQDTTFMGEVKTLIARLPPLILLIWWNLHEKRRKLTQLVMLVVGTFSGCYLAYLVNKMPPKKSAIAAAATKQGKKKKWSKGKVKDKAQNAVYLDKALYERVIKEVPTFKMITPSILIDRLKINGSVARLAIRHFEREGQIKRLIHHHGQLVYTRTGSD